MINYNALDRYKEDQKAADSMNQAQEDSKDNEEPVIESSDSAGEEL